MAIHQKNKQKLLAGIAVVIVIGICMWFGIFQKPYKQQQPASRHIAVSKNEPNVSSQRLPKKPDVTMQSPAMQSPAMQSPAMQSPAMQSPAAQSPAAQSPAAQSPAAPETSIVVPTPVKDTVLPHIHAEPTGGIFDTCILVKLVADKPCAIEWKKQADTTWITYNNACIRIDTTTAIIVRVAGSNNTTIASFSEIYEIRKKSGSPLCPEGMVQVDSDSGKFCIDRYEWPNKKGNVPVTYVSLYQAIDSCTAAGKRLCTSDEWIRACSGPNNDRYPYGAEYDINTCVTNDTVPRPSGSRRACRGYYDVYDMSGNIAEWTNSHSQKYSQYYNVMGGFWESGSQSSCYDIRFSYYPQNRHNPVGFRCCRDIITAPAIQQGVR
jgi:hypothetical protein